MKIGDKEVRNAVETIVSELENAEAMIATLNNQIADLDSKLEDRDIEIDQLKNDILELDSEVKRLDDALADTYITQLDATAKREDETS